jgi:uncharacterized protein (DUF2141 family)
MSAKAVPILVLVTVFALASSVRAQQEFAPMQMRQCGAEIHDNCAGVKSGGGRVVACLVQNQAKLSPGCKAAVAPSDLEGAAPGVSVTVSVKGIHSDKGFVWVAITDDAGTFPGGRRMIAVPAKAGAVEVVFRHLRPNSYAVMAYHDENDNGRLDTDPNGIPTEGYCFSNGVIGPPAFQASLVKVSGDTRVSLSMNYL